MSHIDYYVMHVTKYLSSAHALHIHVVSAYSYRYLHCHVDRFFGIESLSCAYGKSEKQLDRFCFSLFYTSFKFETLQVYNQIRKHSRCRTKQMFHLEPCNDRDFALSDLIVLIKLSSFLSFSFSERIGICIL